MKFCVIDNLLLLLNLVQKTLFPAVVYVNNRMIKKKINKRNF